MPEKSDSTGSVFLSYASQDAEAAARICEALQAAGIEVWLDKSALHGGDARDAQIKKRIQVCALFIPVISAHTNARSEGYFRGEWNLATRRLMNMAQDAAFLVPVVIDGLREADARVPDEFLQAQWTWLPDGKTPEAFALRVRQLLEDEPARLRHARSGDIGKREPSTDGKHRARVAGLALVGLVLVAGAAASWYYLRAANAPEPTLAPESGVMAAASSEKSIAVMPFVNMSSEAEQEYFSDGISEQLLYLLARIPGLRVISRSSTFSFKGQKIEVPEIARRLNVTYVLEGSVRKAGD